MASFNCVTEIIRIFHSCYFDCRGTFQTVLDSYCCVMSRKYLTEKGNGYFSFRRYLGCTAPSYFRIAAIVITDVLFQQFLIHTAV